jgi:hypothetical protein
MRAGFLLPASTGASASAALGSRITRPISMRLAYVTSWNQAVISTNAISRFPATCPSWSQWSSLYDEFRVKRMRITVFGPSTASFYTTVGAGAAYSPGGIAAAYDNDQFPSGFWAGLSASQFVDYGNCQLAPAAGAAVFEFGLPSAQVVASGVLVNSEWTNTSVSAANFYGTVGLLAFVTSPYVSNPTVNVVVEYDVDFRMRSL